MESRPRTRGFALACKYANNGQTLPACSRVLDGIFAQNDPLLLVQFEHFAVGCRTEHC